MGEIADMMLEGTLCEQCGVYIDDTFPGHPRNCGCSGKEVHAAWVAAQAEAANILPTNTADGPAFPLEAGDELVCAGECGSIFKGGLDEQ